MNSRLLIIIVVILFWVQMYSQTQQNCENNRISLSDETIMEYWHSGKTLPVEMTRQYPWPDLKLNDDKGINVLIDIAHQCSFSSMWELPQLLQSMGYRAIGSMACLNTILQKGGKSRIRAYYDKEKKIFPFAWWDNPEFNIVYTEQTNEEAQEYTNDEINALEQFVANGGGLIIVAAPKNAEIMNTWSINKLAQRFGVTFLSESDTYFDMKYAVIEGQKLDTLIKGENGKPLAGFTPYEKGFVVLSGHPSALKYDKKDSDEKKTGVNDFVSQVLQKVSRGKEPIGGLSSFPITMGGGGPVYPELEQQMNKIVLYYAANQKTDLIKCVHEDVPFVMNKVEHWLPSKPTEEPMYLLLAAGDGGGWAVNAFRPKENGIISLNSNGILSIFAHELAHTMAGPENWKGGIAGNTPILNTGEAHAGWFQGKINALYDTTLLQKSNRNCNIIFEKTGVLAEMDLSKDYETDEGRKNWGRGTAWYKTWYIWQKLDDRYGPTWYPRWKWIQHNRWADTPDKNLTWDEMIEDMSLAVGEDLFPFFVKLGTTVNKQRLEMIEYEGKQIALPSAPIELTPAGNVRTEDIGNYKLPVR